MMAYFHVSTRKISDEISSECRFWSSIYSVSQVSSLCFLASHWMRASRESHKILLSPSNSSERWTLNNLLLFTSE